VREVTVYELRRTEIDLEENERWRSSFISSIRNIVRSLWNGSYDYYQAYEVMDMAITNGFTRAWWDGADDVGISPNELTPAERAAMHEAILEQRQYIDGFLTAIEEGSKANGGLLKTQFARARLWTKRYDDVRNMARAMAGRDQKLRWVLHPAEHCKTCLALAGKVKRASYWYAHVVPNSPKLACVASANGIPVCKCTLEPTDDHCTPGPLPMGLGERALFEGGPGSGNWGHKGIPGQQGGSAPGPGLGSTSVYREFESDEEAHEYATETLSGGVEARMGGVGDAVINYTKEDYMRVNGYLRGRFSEEEILKRDQKTIEGLDKLMTHEDSVVQDNITVMREFGWSFFDDKPVGTKFRDKAFVSTSVNPNPRRYADAVKVNVPKGTKAAYLEPLTQVPWEYELLLDRGQVFEVMQNDSDGVVVRVMP